MKLERVTITMYAQNNMNQYVCTQLIEKEVGNKLPLGLLNVTATIINVI